MGYKYTQKTNYGIGHIMKKLLYNFYDFVYYKQKCEKINTRAKLPLYHH